MRVAPPLNQRLKGFGRSPNFLAQEIKKGLKKIPWSLMNILKVKPIYEVK